MSTGEPADRRLARELWLRLETLHAVTYFADESRQAGVDAGLRGFWMGYFAFRAAPLGPVGPSVVEASFANFAPDMVARAIPDAWALASPESLCSVRVTAAAAALRRVMSGGALAGGNIEAVARECLEPLRAVIASASALGRPLFAANREVAAFEDPVAELWQLATTLREHRGDGHVSVLAAEGLDGVEVHLLHAAAKGVSGEVFRPNRGWSADAWAAAVERLIGRGLLDPSSTGDEPAVTEAGRLCFDEIEDRTDALAAAAYRAALGADTTEELLERLTPPARMVVGSDVLPFPNPMGLPAWSAG